jgi:hypothetical protein
MVFAVNFLTAKLPVLQVLIVMQITAHQNIITVLRNSSLCCCYPFSFGNWQGNDLVTETLRKTAYAPNFNFTQIAELQWYYPIRFLPSHTYSDY